MRTILAIIASIFLTPVAFGAVIIESEISTEPCINIDADVADVLSKVPDAIAVESGNTITITAPSRDVDLQWGFDENRCINYSALLSKAPVT